MQPEQILHTNGDEGIDVGELGNRFHLKVFESVEVDVTTPGSDDVDGDLKRDIIYGKNN